MSLACRDMSSKHDVCLHFLGDISVKCHQTLPHVTTCLQVSLVTCQIGGQKGIFQRRIKLRLLVTLYLYSSCSSMPCLIRHSLLIKSITNTESMIAPFYNKHAVSCPPLEGLAVLSPNYLIISISQSLPLVLFYLLLMLEMGGWWPSQKGRRIQA